MPKPISVLVLDDDRDFLSAMERLFSSEPYAIVTTTHPFEALSLLSREAIKVIVSDERMPLVSGANFLQEVRKNFPGVIRILLTGHADMRSAEEAVNKSRVFAFFSKPCEPNKLMAAVRRGMDAFDEAVPDQNLLKSFREERTELLLTLASAKLDLDQLASGTVGPISPEQNKLIVRAVERVMKVSQFLKSI